MANRGPAGMNDGALYLDRVAESCRALPESHRVVFLDVVNERGEYALADFVVPRSVDCDPAARELRERYLLARLNNLFVTFGGARLTVFSPREDGDLTRDLERALDRFDFDRPTNDRAGFGSFANYMARINRAAGLPAFTVAWRDIADFVPPDPAEKYRLFRGDRIGERRELLRRAAGELGGKLFVGLDVGGTSIKAAVVVDGRIAALYNLPWHPATFGHVHEMVDPILAISRMMAGAASLYLRDPGHPVFAEMRECGLEENLAAMTGRARRVAEALGAPARPLDGLVCGFPDIVIGGKVVGGEVYKMRGIRRRDPAGYDADFAAIMHLDDALRPLCREGGAVVVMNDGFITSNVVAVEKLFDPAGGLEDKCLLAHTIGTEMGTGVISPVGAEQDIPLEGYNWILDLGCGEEAFLDPDDVRSAANFNTAAPGTVQKIISQSGLIRLAVRNFQKRRPDRLDELLADGLLVWERREGRRLLVVGHEPRDRRGELVRRLAALLRDGDECVGDAYREMGMAMGVLIEAMGELLDGIELSRFVSGGVVAEDGCFAAFRDGLAAAYPDYGVTRIDTETTYSPLLGKLGCRDLGFLTAVGAAYVASRRSLENAAFPHGRTS
ncbi:MAG: hypothetical protein LBJ46_07670 [Planctomycetota bacterium]|jgi:hypothetical protein|nr:hypothetical protein [Planctomycetota bacterium]